MLLFVFGYSPIEKQPTAPVTPHTTPVAVPLTPDSENELENEKKGGKAENPIPISAVTSGESVSYNSDNIGKVEETARRRKQNSSRYAAATDDQRTTTDAQ